MADRPVCGADLQLGQGLTTRDLHADLDFQRYIIRTMNIIKPEDAANPSRGPDAINVQNPWTGQWMTNRQFLNLHATLIAIFEERGIPR